MITNSVFSETRAKVDAHLINVVNKRGRGLPNHELLSTLILDCKFEPSADKIRYLNKLYWALNDLLSVVSRTVIKFKSVDYNTRIMTSSVERRPVGIGPYIQLEDYVSKPYTEIWFRDNYADKTPAELEQINEPVVSENTKLGIYESEVETPESEDETAQTIRQVVNTWNHPKGTSGVIEDMFKPVLDANYDPIKFEKFVAELTPPDQTPQPTEPGVKGSLKTLPPKVMLLEQLGFFKLPAVVELSFESKGKLVSALCGGSADNAVDYIRNCDPKLTANGKNPYRNHANIQAVDDLLSQLKKD